MRYVTKKNRRFGIRDWWNYLMNSLCLPDLLKWMSMYFPNRDELSLRIVFALPKASRIGLASRICCSIQECFPEMAARYCKINLVLSVFPAPDSPEITTHWFCRCLQNKRRCKFFVHTSGLFNDRFLGERGMASNPKMEYQVFRCIFQKNSAMATTLGLKEMGKFSWEGREKGLPCWLSQFSKTKLRQLTGQTFFPTFPKDFYHFLQT